MAPDKVTKMVLDVNLKCSDCYKKVKKLICKIPEIRDQEYEVEKNKVQITVISCCPEKIRDKLCHKGGRSIQKIVVNPEKPKEAAKPHAAEKPKDSAKAKELPEKPKAVAKKSDTSPKPEVAKMMFEPVHGYPQMYPPTPTPTMVLGYEGSTYGMPVAAPQPSGYGYGYDYGYNGNMTSYYSSSRSSDYLSEENPQGCWVM